MKPKIGDQVHCVHTSGAHVPAICLLVNEESAYATFMVFYIDGPKVKELSYDADCRADTWHWPEQEENKNQRLTMDQISEWEKSYVKIESECQSWKKQFELADAHHIAQRKLAAEYAAENETLRLRLSQHENKEITGADISRIYDRAALATLKKSYTESVAENEGHKKTADDLRQKLGQMERNYRDLFRDRDKSMDELNAKIKEWEKAKEALNKENLIMEKTINNRIETWKRQFGEFASQLDLLSLSVKDTINKL